VSVSGNELCLMTSHLESTRGHANDCEVVSHHGFDLHFSHDQ